MNPYIIAENEYSGSIEFRSKVLFNINHHRAFGYSKELDSFALNKNPLHDPVFGKVNSIEKTVNGYSLVESVGKKGIEYFDKTALQSELTNNLLGFFDFFQYIETEKQYVNFEYVDKFLTRFRIGDYGGLDPVYLDITRAEDGRLYTGDFPLSDEENIPFMSISFKESEIVVNEDLRPIRFEMKLQKDIVEMIKALIKVGL